MNKLVCAVGMPGAGKTELANWFSKKEYKFYRFGQVVLDYFVESKIKPSEAKEKIVREMLRKKEGMDAIAKILFPKLKKSLQTNNVVVDGLYSFSEYKYLKNKFGNRMIVIAVFAPPETRYERISSRKSGKRDKKLQYRPFTKKEAKSRDFAEIENIEKGGPIAMADYTIVNDGSFAKFKNQISKIHAKINKG